MDLINYKIIITYFYLIKLKVIPSTTITYTNTKLHLIKLVHGYI